MIGWALLQAVPPPGKAPPDPGRVVVLVMVLMGLVLLLGGAVLWIRARLLRKDRDVGGDDGMLESMRRLRDRGLMSEEEYARTRDRMRRRLQERLGVAGKPDGDGRKVGER